MITTGLIIIHIRNPLILIYDVISLLYHFLNSNNPDYEKTKELIEQYIYDSKGEATQNDVVHHIEKAPKQVRTSRVTTIGLIEELEKGHRIKISKGERQGQSHRLSTNTKSQFNRFNQNLPAIEKHIEELQTMGREADLIMWNLLFKLDVVNRTLFEKDAQILNQKILKLLLLLVRKKVESTPGLSQKNDIPKKLEEQLF